MNLGFFVIGAIIFSIYVWLTFWNIFYSNKKQREENYPNLNKNTTVDVKPPSDQH